MSAAPRNLIISTDDFVGFHELAASSKITPLLQKYIDRYERQYLMWLLSEAMGLLFIADLDPTTKTPLSARFQALFNPFDHQDLNNRFYVDYFYDGGKTMRHSDGIKSILLSCVFYHFVADTESSHSQASVTKSQVDAAIKADAWRFAERRFNDGLESWENIKWFILSDPTFPTLYPEYVKTDLPSAKYSAIL
jgi:hypothetical protein